MANNFRISNVAAKDLADAFDDAVNVGSTASTIGVYTGAQPTDPDTAIGAQVLLATCTFSDPAFGAATDASPGGLITADVITDDSSADATGTAAWFRISATGTGADDVADGEAGISGADLNFNTVAITSGSTVSVTAFTVTMPES
jgi:hypothetical protein